MNTKTTILLVILTVFLTGVGRSQTNVPVLVTNVVAAHPDFRRVDGILYNTAKSTLWQEFRARVDYPRDGLLIVTTLTERKRAFGIMGTVAYDRWDEDAKQISLTNAPNVATGDVIRFRCMKVGKHDFDPGLLEVWDCGTINKVVVVKPAPRASAAAK